MIRSYLPPLALLASLVAGLCRGEAPREAWPMFRGCAEGSGRSAGVLQFPLEERWTRGFDKTAFDATPVIANGTIFIGDADGTLHALSLANGETIWSVASENGYAASAAVAGEGGKRIVIAGDTTGLVRAFDAGTGKPVWEYECEGEISGGPNVIERPDGSRVLVGSQDASLSCLDAATGRLLWKHSIADQIRCSPTVAGGRVLIAGCDGKLHVIEADTGKELAAVPIDGPTGTTPAAHGSDVFFGTEGGGFFAIDAREPGVRWRVGPTTGGRQSYRSSAAIAEGLSGPLAIVGTRSRAIEAFAVADGRRVWRTAMRGRVDGSPVVVAARQAAGQPPGPPEMVAIVGDAAGRIVAVRVADGGIHWEFDAGGGFAASPAVADGRLVLAGEDGVIRCFSSAGGKLGNVGGM